MNEYKNIINFEHYEPRHPRMTIYKRSAQFAPFAALSGYSEQIAEARRLTAKKKELSEDKKEEINNNLIRLINNKDLIANITYFSKDKYKAGGEYITVRNRIKKIDNFKNIIVLDNNQKINISNIIELSIENIDIK